MMMMMNRNTSLINFIHISPIDTILAKTRFLLSFLFRHKSKFHKNVQDETTKTKAAHRTMGPAKVDTRPPEFFLKSHEKEPVYNQSQYWSLYHSDYY